jgi:ferrous iron transport protein A
MTLAQAKTGQICVIREISGDSRFLSRITSAGLSLGTPVEILQNNGKYPALVFARDTMLAVNSREAQQISVEVIQS